MYNMELVTEYISKRGKYEDLKKEIKEIELKLSKKEWNGIFDVIQIERINKDLGYKNIEYGNWIRRVVKTKDEKIVEIYKNFPHNLIIRKCNGFLRNYYPKEFYGKYVISYLKEMKPAGGLKFGKFKPVQCYFSIKEARDSLDEILNHILLLEMGDEQ